MRTLDGSHPLAQQVVMLRHSRRFGEGSGIGQLARRVNQQLSDEARQLLKAGHYDDVFSLPLRASTIRSWNDWCLRAMVKVRKAIGTT